jgi:hypothetical protein
VVVEHPQQVVAVARVDSARVQDLALPPERITRLLLGLAVQELRVYREQEAEVQAAIPYLAPLPPMAVAAAGQGMRPTGRGQTVVLAVEAAQQALLTQAARAIRHLLRHHKATTVALAPQRQH